jgi:heat shock protein HslJ
MRLGMWTVRGLAAAGALSLAGCVGVDDIISRGAEALKTAPVELTGKWRLLSLQESGQPEVAIADPELFTAEFDTDARVALKADCNRCGSGFTAIEERLFVGPMACTRAACPSAPLDTTYADLVSGVQTWSVSADRLELSSKAGTLRFRR